MKLNTAEIYKLLIITLLAAGLTACATSRTAAQRHGAVSYAAAKQSPEVYKGGRVVWGGQVTGVTNGTELIVSEIPLYGPGKAPIYGAKSLGTFIVQSPGPLDPKLFQVGEVITLNGHIMGQASGVPEVQMDKVRFWQLQGQPDLSEGPANTDDYPFDVPEPGEPIPGWVYHYVPKNEMSQHAGLGQTQHP
jgi:starvation-inducible outer membrane lipoprotein